MNCGKNFVIFLFSFSSYLISFPLGIALGNLFRGVPINENGNFFLLLWTYFLPGIDAGIVDISTLFFGFLSSVFFALHGSLFLNMKMNHALQKKCQRIASSLLLLLPLLSIISYFWTSKVQTFFLKNLLITPFSNLSNWSFFMLTRYFSKFKIP